MSREMLDMLLRRRSVSAAFLGEPGPGPEELRQILTAAARVPDHKKLAPWRFVLLEGTARGQLGERLATILAAEQPGLATPERLAQETQRFQRAPLVVSVVSRVVDNPAAPEWEQVLSAGACCHNLCLAANALGYGTNWITEWCAYSAGVARELGLAAGERVAGFVYIGTPRERPGDRERPALEALTTHWAPRPGG